MNWTVGAYVAYLLIAVPITVWVASTLSHNGRVFLADVFESISRSRMRSTGCWSSASTCSTSAS